MANTIYKRLFELRVLHDFYLSESQNGQSFFGLSADLQLSRLSKILKLGRYNIHQDLGFDADADTKRILKNHRMKLLPNALGFALVIEVKKEEENGAYYRPVIPLEEGLRMVFKIVGKNGSFANFTNIRIKDALPAQYFFSNESAQLLGNNKVLARPIELYDSGNDYRMGDLVESGGQIKEVYYKVQNNSRALMDVEGRGFVNKADKYLLPQKFIYRTDSPIQGEMRFVLLDENDTEIRVVEKEIERAKKIFNLDFSDEKNNDGKILKDGFYTLTVEHDGLEIERREVLVSSKYHSPNQMGVLELRPMTSEPELALLDGEGRLLTHVQPNGAKVLHPVFEMRFLSRRTFWRYRRPEGFGTSDTGISDQLTLVNNKLITRVPIALTRGLRLFPSSSGTNMPNPDPAQLRVENDKLINDIRISSINQLG